MPYESEKQQRFFEAIRHGFKPDRVKAPPMSVVNEFHNAEVRKRKALAEALTNHGGRK